MMEVLFLSVLACVLAILFSWGFRHLPDERWQMMAAIPLRKGGQNWWQGLNVTYYGFFIATSLMTSLALLLVLLGAMGISLPGVMLAILMVMACCLPAARLVAMAVEKKRHTFTVGGASFVGIIVAPWSIMVTNKLLAPYDCVLPVMPVLAAMSTAYTLGEGLGRLACISFGCCYGKPVRDCSRMLQRLFSRFGCVFTGETKKVAYEAQLTGEKLVPIQALTCILYTSGALIGCALFLVGWFTYALIFTISLTQIWRVLSEALRADFRGFGRISSYQKMSIAGVLYVIAVALLIPSDTYAVPHIARGMMALWNPAVIFGLQFSWLIFFVTFGRSTVTTSAISFELIQKHI
jgi:hypothetical protein